MLFLFQSLIVLLSFLLGGSGHLNAHQAASSSPKPHAWMSNKVWRQVRTYLLPPDHPAKEKLDALFSHSQVLKNFDSLQKAGFESLPPQHQTQVIVAKHRELPGYILKLYLDEQTNYRGKPEHYHWIKRIQGARLIQQYLDQWEEGQLFKVPQKWIYLLPDGPTSSPFQQRKHFVLVAEDMCLFAENENEALWGSAVVTKRLLKALYTITTALGLRDSAKPANCPFSQDGKVAFVDTEVYHRQDVRYWKLTPYLSPLMQAYWDKLTHHKSR